MSVGEEIHQQPSLETKSQKTGNDAYSCLQEEGLEACGCCNVCSGEHYQQHKEREFLVISDEFFSAVWADDGCESAEEHCDDQRCCSA